MTKKKPAHKLPSPLFTDTVTPLTGRLSFLPNLSGKDSQAQILKLHRHQMSLAKKLASVKPMKEEPLPSEVKDIEEIQETCEKELLARREDSQDQIDKAVSERKVEFQAKVQGIEEIKERLKTTLFPNPFAEEKQAIDAKIKSVEENHQKIRKQIEEVESFFNIDP